MTNGLDQRTSAGLAALHGRVLDVDANEYTPAPRWGDVFGERGARFVESAAMLLAMAGDLNVDAADGVEISEDTVWTSKGPEAPGAVDLNRRPAVLDAMGIRRQLVYPTMGLLATLQALGGLGWPLSDEARSAAWDAMDAVNDWSAERTSRCPERVRFVAFLKSMTPDATAKSLTAQAERLIGAGARAVLIPTGVPPAGLSPAAEALDPFYELLATSDVTLVAHPPSALGYTNDAWLGVDPIGLGASHAPVENFLRMMTLGGVFERHPALRFGAIKSGAGWVGPLAEFMDFVVDGQRAPMALTGTSSRLSLKPSEYLARNVRVTPYNFEPVDVCFQRYPQLQDVFCYSSHYPDPTGGEWSLRRFHDMVAPLGAGIVEKFFCTNAELLLP